MITAIDKNTALVLIDLQNSIVANTTAHPVDAVLENSNKLINAFRNKNLPVVFVNVNPKNAAWLKSRKEAKMPALSDDENTYKITDKLNANSSDIFITKHTWNAFFETALHNELKNRNVTGIVLGGISTSIGVEGTARAASELGYNISFALDAITDRAIEAHERSVQFIFPRIGELGSTDEIIEMMNKN
jgi:nicotinamidase-related amidase